MSALYGSVFLLGNITGPLLGSVLASFGFRMPFFIYAGMLLAATLVVTLFLRGVGEREPDTDARPKYTFAEAMQQPVYRALLITSSRTGGPTSGYVSP